MRGWVARCNTESIKEKDAGMKELKENIKKYLLVKHAEDKLKEYNSHISKSIPWIQRKSLTNNIETHIKVLLNSLINESETQSLRRNEYIVDSILKYTLGKSENLLKVNKKAKDIKSYMQLNSYVVYDEISRGLMNHQDKKTIKYNIEKTLSSIQERLNANVSPEEVLNELISA